MLQVKDICKQYRTGGFVQKALDHVSLNLRENEFVAILGPSGSGKTTLLNIIGGLDRYDSGDLIINGISTKKYKDRDWDSYRNHTVGFVFQSYNLIPHQTVLANVELALTISGISKRQRRIRAKKALEEVGLGSQLHKKPNQMSGGQMQRVAIARALVNNPDILLADEPTGALDSDTSVQVMELLKKVASDRLVVMVTHNPELAQQYATRIVNLKDGVIRSDTDPYTVEESVLAKPVHKNMGKSSMSFLTSLALSFNNLRTKKARTLLTAFAGSIGIIGIALILSISNGVNGYIAAVEENTLSEYPVQIQSTGVDMSSMLLGAESAAAQETKESGSEVKVAQMITGMLSQVESNDLESLKNWIDSGKSGIEEYANAIEYSYDVSPQIYRLDGDDGVRQVNPDQSFASLGISSGSGSSLLSSVMSTDVFYEMPENTSLYQDQYEVKAGRWPQEYNECVLVLSSGGYMSDFLLYTLGLRDAAELDRMVEQFAKGESVTAPDDIRDYDYDEILGITFWLVNSADYYEYDEEYGIWKDKTDDSAYMRALVENGEKLTIVGIVQPAEGEEIAMLSAGLGYLPKLTAHVIENAKNSRIVQDQLVDRDTDVFTGEAFDAKDGEENGLDLSTLFSIDADALSQAFQMDTGSLSLDLSGLSGLNVSIPDFSDRMDLKSSIPDLGSLLSAQSLDIDFSALLDPAALSAQMPQMPEFDLSEMIKEIKVTVTQTDVEELLADLIKGYQSSTAGQSNADVEKLLAGYQSYLTSEKTADQIFTEISALIKNGTTVSVSWDQLLSIGTRLMAEYQQYVKENSLTADSETLLAYLSSQTVQNQILSEAETLLKNNVTVNVTKEQLQTVFVNVMNGYPDYAKTNDYPVASDIAGYFLAYLNSQEGQKTLSDGISKMVDTSALEQKFSQIAQDYMSQAATAYASALTKAMQSAVNDMMEQMSAQVSKALEQAMSDMMEQIAEGLQNSMTQAMSQVTVSLTAAVEQAMTQMGGSLADSFSIDPETFADAIQMNMEEDELSELMMSLLSYEDATCDGNLEKLGYADTEKPGEIDIYPQDFQSKEEILRILDSYNEKMEAAGEEEKTIRYTDIVGTLMSTVTTIVNTVSYVLVAFVAISLVVSSIMIGVITYISVLERRKEIGILRAIGASRRNISQVFNAETFIIGLCAGLMGIGITLLLLIPGNLAIHKLAGSTQINAALPPLAGVALIALSVLLTLLGGLIPAKKAAKSDPVTALRSE